MPSSQIKSPLELRPAPPVPGPQTAANTMLAAQLKEAIRSGNADEIDNLAEKAEKAGNALDEMELRELVRGALCTGKSEKVLIALTGFPGFDANAGNPNVSSRSRSLLSIAAENKNIRFCMHLLKLGARTDAGDLSPHALKMIRAATIIDDIGPALPPAGQARTPLQSALANYDLDGLHRILKMGAGNIPLNAQTLGRHWMQALEKDRPDLACAILALSEEGWWPQAMRTFGPAMSGSYKDVVQWLKDYENGRTERDDAGPARTSRPAARALPGLQRQARSPSVSGQARPVAPEARDSVLKKSFFMEFQSVEIFQLPREIRNHVIDAAIADVLEPDSDRHMQLELRDLPKRMLVLAQVNSEFADEVAAHFFGKNNLFGTDPFGNPKPFKVNGASEIARLAALARSKGPAHLIVQPQAARDSDVRDADLAPLRTLPIKRLELWNCSAIDGSGFAFLPPRLEEFSIRGKMWTEVEDDDDALQLTDEGLAGLASIDGEGARPLKSLEIENSLFITGTGLAAFGNLESLTLKACERMTPEGIGCLPSSLKELCLDRSHIGDRHLLNLPAMPNLKTLSLCDRMEALDPSDRIELQQRSLAEIEEDRTPGHTLNVQITDKGLERLLDRDLYPSLREIDLTGSFKVSDQMKQRLRARGVLVSDD